MFSKTTVADFARAGKATITVENTKTGGRFTYRIEAPDHGAPIRFVKVLTGADNTRDYTYLGQVFTHNDRWSHGRKSHITADAQSAKVWAWFWARATAGTLPECISVHHSGKCGRCAKTLTTPASIEAGYGPVCIKMK